MTPGHAKWHRDASPALTGVLRPLLAAVGLRDVPRPAPHRR